MENILNLLIYLFIIIMWMGLGALSRKKTPQKKRAPSPFPEESDEEEIPIPEPFKEFRKLFEPERPKTKPVRIEKKELVIDKEKKKEALPKKEETTKLPTEKPPAHPLAEFIGSDNIRNAIILSEILAPPKCMRS